MPLTNEILAKHPNEMFVETGTFHGEAVAIALAMGFTTIHTCDVDPVSIDEVKPRYADNPNVHVTLCGSQNMLERLLPTLNCPTTFWLDAHPQVDPMPLFDSAFPLLQELLTIKRLLKGPGHVILMDDMRTFVEHEKNILFFIMKQLWPDAIHTCYDTNFGARDVYCCIL